MRLRVSNFIATCLAATLLAFASYATAGESSRSTAYQMRVVPSQGTPVSLHVEEYGSGPPVLLLHGIGGSGYSFRDIIGPLARRHRVITLDLKGFGASEKPFDLAYGAADQARLVLAFLRQRGLSRVDVIGHSFGGAVALVAALSADKVGAARIARLVLLNVPAYPQPMRRGLEFLTLPVLPYVALAAVPPILTARAALETINRKARPSTDRDAIAYADPLYEAGGRHALIATTRAIAAYQAGGSVPDYSRMRKPVMLIWCRQDPTVPLATGIRLAHELPHARLSVIDGCDHAPAEENPAATLGLISRFLSR